MNKKIVCSIVCLLCILTVWAKPGNKMYINIEKAELKSGTGFFSEVQNQLPYGTQVVIIEEKGKWAFIKATKDSSITGWIPQANLTKKKIVTNNPLYTINASTEELALAGKGFSAEIEASFSDAATKDALDTLNALENTQLSVEALQEFIEEGNLFTGE